MVLSEPPRTWLQRCLVRVVSAVSGFPLANLHDIEEYRARLTALGFTDIRCEDLSKDVFEGFSTFVEDHYGHFSRITAW
jgi:hypothetical protein